MKQDSEFKYTAIPPGSKPVSAEEWEKIVLGKFEEAEEMMETAFWDMAQMYCQTDRKQIGIAHVERMLAWIRGNPEKEARCYLAMGCIMEQVQNYDSAISYYRRALQLEPANNRTWYFIHNNLGYCLNHFGRFDEAEPYCRKAIEIAPERHNAHKNLGISLEGRGFYAHSALSFINAVRSEAGDARAARHLENLVAAHPEITLAIPDIMEQVEDRLVEMFAGWTGQTPKRIRQDMNHDFFMTAEEAREYGIIDSILQPFHYPEAAKKKP